MIRTVTLNTGFDELFTVSALDFGGVSDLREHRTLASGKGINAARTIATLGEPVKAYGLIGKTDRERFQSLLQADGVGTTLVPIDASTRRNLTVLDLSSGRPAAHVRAPGFTLDDPAPVDSLRAELESDIQPGDLVSLHGSLPQGLDPRTWARLGRAALDRGAVLLLDLYGEPLLHALDQPVALAKPNEEEIRALPGVTGPDDALRYLAARGVGLPVVSRGAEGLSYLVDGRIGTARVAVEKPRFLVGAGDACMGGLLVAWARGMAAPEAVRFAVEVAAAHVAGEGMEAVQLRA
jgi:1-phosphofructokinase family hexose kinase